MKNIIFFRFKWKLKKQFEINKADMVQYLIKSLICPEIVDIQAISIYYSLKLAITNNCKLFITYIQEEQ